MDLIADIGVEDLDNGSRVIKCKELCNDKGLNALVFYSSCHLGGREGKKVIYLNIARHIHTIKEIALPEISSNKSIHYAMCFYQDLEKDPVAKTFVDENGIQHMAFDLTNQNYFLGSMIDNLIYVYKELQIAIQNNKLVYVMEHEVDAMLLLKLLENQIYPYKPEFLL